MLWQSTRSCLHARWRKWMLLVSVLLCTAAYLLYSLSMQIQNDIAVPAKPKGQNVSRGHGPDLAARNDIFSPPTSQPFPDGSPDLGLDLDQPAYAASQPLPVFGGMQESFLVRYFRSQGMNASLEVGGRAWPPTELLDIERRYLDTPDLSNTSRLPEEMMSRVSLLTPPSPYRVGDRVQFRVDLYDQLGRPRSAGLDDVRVWLTSPGQGHSLPAEVTDQGNGSYLGEAILRWEGKAFVLASLAYSRELLRTVILLRHTLLSTRWITAIFVRDDLKLTEATPCLSSPRVPGYPATCNLTEYNDRVPWYCGHPTHPGLSCERIQETGNLAYLQPLPLSAHHLDMFQRMNGPRNHVLRLIPNSITLSALPGPAPVTKPLCSSLPAKHTWEPLSGWGWLQAGVWRPNKCAIRDMAPNQLRQCLSNTAVLLFGDSNSRYMYNWLRELLVGHGTGEDQKQISHPWHAQYQLRIPELNTSLVFAPHARPFNTGHNRYELSTLSLSLGLGQLPRHRHYVIVIHYYMHFTFTPLAVYRDRLRQAKTALRDFLRSEPSAKVFLRGPHAVYDGQGFHAQFAGDKFALFYLRLLRQEFEELRDRVFLLDLWPLTLASENVNLHPSQPTLTQIMRVLLEYACPPAG